MLQNTRVTAFTAPELLRENQQGQGLGGKGGRGLLNRVLEPLFNKVVSLKMFYCEIYELFKNAFLQNTHGGGFWQ